MLGKRPCSRLVALCALFFYVGCGDDEAERACLELEEASCETDKACSATDPCSMDCDALGSPRDAAELEQCVDAYRAIALPSAQTDPLGNAAGCGLRASKKTECVDQFL